MKKALGIMDDKDRQCMNDLRALLVCFVEHGEHFRGIVLMLRHVQWLCDKGPPFEELMVEGHMMKVGVRGIMWMPVHWGMM